MHQTKHNKNKKIEISYLLVQTARHILISMSSSKSGYHRSFSFKLDSKTIRRIYFKKKNAANQVFVEAVEVFNSPSTVLDTRFTAELRDVITLCSSKTAHSDSVEILVCLVVPPSVSSALALNQLCYLQQL